MNETAEHQWKHKRVESNLIKQNETQCAILMTDARSDPIQIQLFLIYLSERKIHSVQLNKKNSTSLACKTTQTIHNNCQQWNHIYANKCQTEWQKGEFPPKILIYQDSSTKNFMWTAKCSNTTLQIRARCRQKIFHWFLRTFNATFFFKQWLPATLVTEVFNAHRTAKRFKQCFAKPLISGGDVGLVQLSAKQFISVCHSTNQWCVVISFCNKTNIIPQKCSM